MRKRAQSEIITTILLILIVLAAIVVVWIVVTRFLNPIANTQCVEVRLDIAKALDNGANRDYVSVTRMAGGRDEDVTGVKFLVNGEVKYPTHVNGVQCSSSLPDPCNALFLGNLTQLETKTFEFTTGTINTGDEVKVAALVTSDQKVCDPIASKRAT